jgi:hypothetical protein
MLSMCGLRPTVVSATEQDAFSNASRGHDSRTQYLCKVVSAVQFAMVRSLYRPNSRAAATWAAT